MINLLKLQYLLNAGIDYGRNTGLRVDPVARIHSHPLQEPKMKLLKLGFTLNFQPAIELIEPS
jgi:hypothetical protein